VPEITLPPEDDGFFVVKIGEQQFNTDLYDIFDALIDCGGREKRWEYIKQLCKDNGITVPISSRRADKIIDEIRKTVEDFKKKEESEASPPETSASPDSTDMPSGD
jgi:hypothetical protein